VPPRPTTSTYAPLGFLALRSWSAYELAQQATRSLRYAHPRTESHLYEEAKRLLHLGWATSHVEHHGRRRRTIYEITGDGRRALHAWFATPPRDPQLDFEALLRLLFADQTDKATLDGWLEETADGARRLFEDAVERFRSRGDQSWPRTDVLGMTDRSRETLDAVLEGRSVVEPGR
jgi:DNA-binding PadR family transcriptional regulator